MGRFQPLCHKTKSCKYHAAGRCKKGAACTFAHSVAELMPRPVLLHNKGRQQAASGGLRIEAADAGGIVAQGAGGGVLNDACSGTAALSLHGPAPEGGQGTGGGSGAGCTAGPGAGDAGAVPPAQSLESHLAGTGLSVGAGPGPCQAVWAPEAQHASVECLVEGLVPPPVPPPPQREAHEAVRLPSNTTTSNALDDENSSEQVTNQGEGGSEGGDPESGKGRARLNKFHKTQLCMFHQMGKCKKRASCRFAHGLDELRPVPDLYRTKLCPTKLGTGKCSDEDCRFAHSADELRHFQADQMLPDDSSSSSMHTPVATSPAYLAASIEHLTAESPLPLMTTPTGLMGHEGDRAAGRVSPGQLEAALASASLATLGEHLEGVARRDTEGFGLVPQQQACGGAWPDASSFMDPYTTLPPAHGRPREFQQLADANKRAPQRLGHEIHRIQELRHPHMEQFRQDADDWHPVLSQQSSSSPAYLCASPAAAGPVAEESMLASRHLVSNFVSTQSGGIIKRSPATAQFELFGLAPPGEAYQEEDGWSLHPRRAEPGPAEVCVSRSTQGAEPRVPRLRVKNTFLTVSDQPGASGLLPRSRTLPAPPMLGIGEDDLLGVPAPDLNTRWHDDEPYGSFGWGDAFPATGPCLWSPPSESLASTQGGQPCEFEMRGLGEQPDRGAPPRYPSKVGELRMSYPHAEICPALEEFRHIPRDTACHEPQEDRRQKQTLHPMASPAYLCTSPQGFEPMEHSESIMAARPLDGGVRCAPSSIEPITKLDLQESTAEPKVPRLRVKNTFLELSDEQSLPRTRTLPVPTMFDGEANGHLPPWAQRNPASLGTYDAPIVESVVASSSLQTLCDNGAGATLRVQCDGFESTGQEAQGSKQQAGSPEVARDWSSGAFAEHAAAGVHSCNPTMLAKDDPGRGEHQPLDFDGTVASLDSEQVKPLADEGGSMVEAPSEQGPSTHIVEEPSVRRLRVKNTFLTIDDPSKLQGLPRSRTLPVPSTIDISECAEIVHPHESLAYAETSDTPVSDMVAEDTCLMPTPGRLLTVVAASGPQLSPGSPCASSCPRHANMCSILPKIGESVEG